MVTLKLIMEGFRCLMEGLVWQTSASESHRYVDSIAETKIFIG